ncbi:MAG: hypothetical protein ACE5EM_06645 [Sphingomonadales bacterium]
MESVYEFDTTPFFTTAANDLIRLLGDDAIYYADKAIEKMKSMGYEEGFHLWKSIRVVLHEKVNMLETIPMSATRH